MPICWYEYVRVFTWDAGAPETISSAAESKFSANRNELPWEFDEGRTGGRRAGRPTTFTPNNADFPNLVQQTWWLALSPAFIRHQGLKPEPRPNYYSQCRALCQVCLGEKGLINFIRTAPVSKTRPPSAMQGGNRPSTRPVMRLQEKLSLRMSISAGGGFSNSQQRVVT